MSKYFAINGYMINHNGSTSSVDGYVVTDNVNDKDCYLCGITEEMLMGASPNKPLHGILVITHYEDITELYNKSNEITRYEQ
jgi:hypothetical protein